jgi:mono/diheme cytochrome c family protein
LETEPVQPKNYARLALVVLCLATNHGAASPQTIVPDRFYQVIDGKVYERTYNDFRRYHSVCNHCHGPDGMGSTVAAPLVDRLPPVAVFRRIVGAGLSSGTGIMMGFAGDPNIAPYIDDIYAYLKARADGALARGRPIRAEH